MDVGDMRNVYTNLVRKPEGNVPLKRARLGWEDNIKMDLKELWYEDVDWTNLRHGRSNGRLL
jgi:hypothetical protein